MGSQRLHKRHFFTFTPLGKSDENLEGFDVQ